MTLDQTRVAEIRRLEQFNAELEQRLAVMPLVIDALADYVENDPDFSSLDRGIGTATRVGMQKLAARKLVKSLKPIAPVADQREDER